MTHWWHNPDWWVAGGTIGAVIIALFGQRLQRWMWPPRLKLELRSECGVMTPVTITDPKTEKQRKENARYYHLTVKNRGSLASNVAVYLTNVQLKGAGGEWYQAWAGEVALLWEHPEFHPLLRPVGATPIHADLFELIRDNWLTLRLVIQPNALPGSTTAGFGQIPGLWRDAIDMVITVQAKGTEGQSKPKLLCASWTGGWADGNTEILSVFKIRPISSIDDLSK